MKANTDFRLGRLRSDTFPAGGKRARVRAVAGIVGALALLAADWPTFGGNAARTGSVAGDRALSPGNVGTLQRRWVATLDRTADSTPIVLSHVRFADGPARAMLFETDKAGKTYGIDARSGDILWRFATSGPKITTATPVADPAGRDIFAGGVDGRVHELVAATGAEVRERGFPVAITRMPEVEKNASALNLANGYLYVVTSGYIGDAGPYDGHLVTIRLRDGHTEIFNSLCSDKRMLLVDAGDDARGERSCSRSRSGMWSRAGAVVDPDPSRSGSVYVATGNGAFDADRGGRDYGDSLLALASDGTRLLDSFTPRNFADLEATDADLGSSAPALLPREPRSRTPLMALEGGKDAVLHLLDRAHLGGVGGALQDFALPGELFTAPALRADSRGITWIYLGFLPGDAGVTALRLTTGADGKSRLEKAWTADARGTSPVVCNDVVFVAHGGGLEALDARTGRLLWSSSAPAAGGTIGEIHWQSPVVLNGWVYVSDQNAHLSAYAVRGG